MESPAESWRLSGILSLLPKSQTLPFHYFVKITALTYGSLLAEGVPYILWQRKTWAYLTGLLSLTPPPPQLHVPLPRLSRGVINCRMSCFSQMTVWRKKNKGYYERWSLMVTGHHVWWQSLIVVQGNAGSLGTRGRMQRFHVKSPHVTGWMWEGPLTSCLDSPDTSHACFRPEKGALQWPRSQSAPVLLALLPTPRPHAPLSAPGSSRQGKQPAPDSPAWTLVGGRIIGCISMTLFLPLLLFISWNTS